MNRSWHTTVLYRAKCWQLPNTALNVYYSSRLFSSIKKHSRYKRRQSDSSMHPNMYFSCPKCLLRPLRTDFVNCYTPYFQSHTIKKRITLLWLTEIEHISFAPVMSNTLELKHRDNLQPTYRSPPNVQTNTFFVPIRQYHRLLIVQNGKTAETWYHSATIRWDVHR